MAAGARAMVLALVVSAQGCGPGADGASMPPDAGHDADAAAPSDAPHDVAPDAPADASDAPAGPCPPEMAHLELEGTCIDRWEAHVESWNGASYEPHSPYETLDLTASAFRAVSSAGSVPQGYISGEQALEACLTAGKRLCTPEEYRTACRGPADTIYPYGASHQADVCNEGRPVHPLLELYGADAGPEIWDSPHMNDPAINQQADTVALTGAKTGCTNAFGTFDMVGNLHEWVDDPAGTFLGGFYVDAEKNGPGCTYTTTAHQFGYHDYSTGFRCCLTP